MWETAVSEKGPEGCFTRVESRAHLKSYAGRSGFQRGLITHRVRWFESITRNQIPFARECGLAEQVDAEGH